jgi:signal transduction histidine kinase/DNA-binding response OmpR family regulator
VSQPLLTVRIRHEHDVVGARQRARQIAAALGFDTTEQTRIATAVSELARNACQYASGGSVEYLVEGSVAPQVLTIRISDTGDGISNLDDVLRGSYRSPTGMGLGIIGTRRLMDHFDVKTGPEGTTVSIRKILPRRSAALGPAEVAQLVARLAADRPSSPIEEVQQQNRELLRMLDELRARQEELERVNRELEDTNRGVVALYAELDERADHLRRADELKTRFLSNMTHEFRTPVNAILALTGLLAERLATPPDTKDELYYIRKSAQQLSDIVDDLLDIAKVEAGKIEVRPAPFEVASLFGALRGMLRPLLVNQSLSLIFEEPDDIPPIFSDESKLSQILRNFISNALKYTERGEVRVSASLSPSRDKVEFVVADTGIGIPPEDVPRIFDEFVQIENPLQRRVKGTGLGLPLSKRLAELLGGTITVDSTFGLGSTFRLVIPLVFSAPGPLPTVAPGKLPVLVVEDADEDLLLVERALSGTRYQMVPARSEGGATMALSALKPAAIVLDLKLHGHDSWDLLARLKRDDATRDIPLLIASTIDDVQKGYALGADAYQMKPISREWLLSTLDALVPHTEPSRVLVVDDEETSRFIMRGMLGSRDLQVAEATSGREALRMVREFQPHVMLLDLRLKDMSGVDVCDKLREDDATAHLPVILVTSGVLTSDERTRYGADRPVLSKSALTRAALTDAIQQVLVGRPTARTH